uniref:Uncharacterized protein n=1 Tax=Bracon brevicornis TaxID=1563983 RepID=A0A6V7JLA0_9HYME
MLQPEARDDVRVIHLVAFANGNHNENILIGELS